MPDINFLSGDDKKEKNSKKEKKNGPGVEWTTPKKEEKDDKKKNQGKKERQNGDKKIDGLDKNRIKESREEVLSEIKKEKKSKSVKENNFSDGFSDWLERAKDRFISLFASKNEDKKGVMVDYQEVFNKEKDKRQNGDKEPVRIDLSSEEKEPPQKVEKDVAKSLEEPKVDISHKKKHKKFFGEKFKFSRPRWESLNVIKTNLIQGEESAFFDWNKKITVLVINIISACLLVGLIYGGLIFWERQINKQGEIILSDIEDINKNIEDTEKGIDEVDNFQKKLSKVAAILDNHIYWTNFFDFLEKNTLSEVYYIGGFSGDTNGEYNLPAVASEYSSIEGQLKVFRNAEEVIGAESFKGSMGKGEEGEDTGGSVSFDIGLKVRPDIFLKKDNED